jgi:hypothetical protein
MARNGQTLSRMEKATTFVKTTYKPNVVLGAALAQKVGVDATIACLHEMPLLLGTMSMALHGMNGVLIKIRERPITSSFGVIFVQYAKTNKSVLSSE